MFYKRYLVHLYIIGFCSKLNTLGYFATNNRTDIMPVWADYAISDSLAGKQHLLLFQYFPDYRSNLLSLIF